MNRTGKRSRGGNASRRVRKLRADSEIAEREAGGDANANGLRAAKVAVALAGVIMVMIVMFHAIGLFS
ncbi:MAG: hypothetical protein OXH52_02295 [Gammaproteobacteria bacterium]|nr:hypothetical protein [Gammaproteobacteria bacterium]